MNFSFSPNILVGEKSRAGWEDDTLTQYDFKPKAFSFHYNGSASDHWSLILFVASAFSGIGRSIFPNYRCQKTNNLWKREEGESMGWLHVDIYQPGILPCGLCMSHLWASCPCTDLFSTFWDRSRFIELFLRFPHYHSSLDLAWFIRIKIVELNNLSCSVVGLHALRISRKWMMILGIPIQSWLTLDDSVSPHLLISHYSLSKGVSFDSVQPLGSLEALFAFAANSPKHQENGQSCDNLLSSDPCSLKMFPSVAQPPSREGPYPIWIS